MTWDLVPGTGNRTWSPRPGVTYLLTPMQVPKSIQRGRHYPVRVGGPDPTSQSSLRPRRCPSSKALHGPEELRASPSDLLVHEPEGSTQGWLRPPTAGQSCSLCSSETPGPGQGTHRALETVSGAQGKLGRACYTETCKGLNHMWRSSGTPQEPFLLTEKFLFFLC